MHSSSTTKSSPTKGHHYAIDAASLLDQCRRNLRLIMDHQKERVNANILDLDRTLLITEQLLHFHFLTLLDYELQEAGEKSEAEEDHQFYQTTNNYYVPTADDDSWNQPHHHGGLDSSSHAVTLDPLMKTVDKLKKVMKKNQRRKRSMSLIHWHQYQVQEQEQQQQQQQQNHAEKGNQRSLLSSSHYSKALKAAQNNIATIHNFNSNPNNNFIDSNFTNSSIPLPLSPPNTPPPPPHHHHHHHHHHSSPFSSPSSPSTPTSTSATTATVRATNILMNKPMEKTALDSLLFRLIVVLQLCLVRIEEADYLLCRNRTPNYDSCHATSAGDDNYSHKKRTDGNNHHGRSYTQQHNKTRKRRPKLWMKLATTSALSCISTYYLTKSKVKWNMNVFQNEEFRSSIVTTGTKVFAFTTSSLLLRRGWRIVCMNARLLNTIFAIEDLHHQWMLVHSVQMGNKENLGIVGDDSSDEQCKHLLNLMQYQRSSTSIWDSQGAFRYGLIKWTMDILYASVGTAIKVNKQRKNSFMLPITAAAAASYYAITGPSGKSAEVISSETESSDLIRNAWGVVSLPAVKTLSLQASRLLKGAAIAERIQICGVSCFILSKKPFPALATAIKRYRRQQERQLSRLTTILEYEEFTYSQRAINLDEYPIKDIIFHLTGGGFFAHTIAGDVPYLMDWSYATSAVVICPEYALLPEHPFPDAIEEVTRVYSSLVNGNAASLLGFQTGRIIVTGESTGGNLATSLCVKLCLDGLVDVDQLIAEKRILQAREIGSENLSPNSTMSDNDENESDESMPISTPGMIRLPNALMLCCPALNLSLELSPSRVLTRDAVLPSSLISTISDAYVPSHLNMSKSDPIVSPYFAPDEILRIFPPTLLYASSEDPLLDDSVHFNTRLRANGVDSDLRAAQNVPHAYWGLGTAGFPEARKVQRECEHWMVEQLHR